MCTRCKNVFEDGMDILKGCPACGWKKFMFVKAKKQGQPRSKPLDIKDLRNKALNANLDGRLIPKGISGGEIRADVRASEELQNAKAAAGLIDIDTKKDQPLPDVKVESIKITAPGTYELNLPSLFEREELIMAVKEGTYLIDLSSAFRKPKKD